MIINPIQDIVQRSLSSPSPQFSSSSSSSTPFQILNPSATLTSQRHTSLQGDGMTFSMDEDLDNNHRVSNEKKYYASNQGVRYVILIQDFSMSYVKLL